MSQHLVDELARYQEYEEYAQKLRHLIEEDDELELRWTNTDAAALGRIEHAIGKRIHDISAQIEAESNKSMDRFRRREVR